MPNVGMHMWGRIVKAVEPVCQEEKVLPRYCEVQGGVTTRDQECQFCVYGGKIPYGVQCVPTTQRGWEAAEGLCRVCACTGEIGVMLLAQEGGHGQHRLHSVLAARHTSRITGAYTGVSVGQHRALKGPPRSHRTREV